MHDGSRAAIAVTAAAVDIRPRAFHVWPQVMAGIDAAPPTVGRDISHPEMSPLVAIVGGGVIGIATACELTRRGVRVEVFDKAEPGAGASFGNAALIAMTHNQPFASPAVRSELPGLLLRRNGPLRIDPRHLAALAPWGLRFLKATRSREVEAGAAALASLLGGAVTAWRDLLGHVDETRWLKEQGLLYVYRSPEAFASGRADAERRRRFGARILEIGAEDVQRSEPALHGAFAGGLVHPDVAHMDRPKLMVDALVAHLREAGVVIHRRAVSAVLPKTDAGATIIAEGLTQAYDHVVLAAGIDSAKIAATLGCRVPLESERGYHVELPEAAGLLSRPVGFGDAKIVLAPLEGRLRVTGIAEFAGRGREPDWRCADILLRNARLLLPGLSDTGMSRWMGERPSTPDSLPVLGASPRSRHVTFAFGHGHLGVTLGAVTARLVSDLLQQREVGDLSAFAPDR